MGAIRQFSDIATGAFLAAIERRGVRVDRRFVHGNRGDGEASPSDAIAIDKRSWLGLGRIRLAQPTGEGAIRCVEL